MESQAPKAHSPTLRYALIGCAATIATTHIQALQRLPAAQLVGMSDINAERGAARAAEVECPFFVNHDELLATVRPDVAVICTPHPFHAPLAIDCLAAGAHVLIEKPLAVEVAEADRIAKAAEDHDRLVAVAFQQRFRPIIEHARSLIEQGVIGSLIRVLCIEPWYRTAAYYRSATWRGTWRGEGGGVLLNQAPHTLDLLCHLVGVPAKVWGWTRTLCHEIECEDTAQAMLEYPNGAPGYFSTSTVEAGRRGRLEIVGDRGAIEIKGEQLTLHQFVPSAREHMASSPELFQSPQVKSETIELPGDGNGHLAVYQDLHRAIVEGRQPRTNAREATKSLELANAIVLSSYTGQSVTLPIDRGAYSTLLEQLRQGQLEQR